MREAATTLAAIEPSISCANAEWPWAPSASRSYPPSTPAATIVVAGSPIRFSVLNGDAALGEQRHRRRERGVALLVVVLLERVVSGPRRRALERHHVVRGEDSELDLARKPRAPVEQALERRQRGRRTIGGEQYLHAVNVTRSRRRLQVARDDDLLGVVGVVAHAKTERRGELQYVVVGAQDVLDAREPAAVRGSDQAFISMCATPRRCQSSATTTANSALSPSGFAM